MSPRMVIVLSCLGVMIGGMDAYYHLHAGGPFTESFWIGLTDAAATPLAAYFVGLAQKSPWGPKP